MRENCREEGREGKREEGGREGRKEAEKERERENCNQPSKDQTKSLVHTRPPDNKQMIRQHNLAFKVGQRIRHSSTTAF